MAAVHDSLDLALLSCAVQQFNTARLKAETSYETVYPPVLSRRACRRRRCASRRTTLFPSRSPRRPLALRISGGTAVLFTGDEPYRFLGAAIRGKRRNLAREVRQR